MGLCPRARFARVELRFSSDPSPPTPNKVEFGAKWAKLSAFFGHNIARGSGGDDGMNPKPNKKLSLGAESYGTIGWKGFFTQSQVLLSSIVWNRFRAINWIFRHLSLKKYRKTFSFKLLKCSFFNKMLSVRCSWSVGPAKELRIPCQTGVFGMDIQFTQKELRDYLNDMYWIELLQAFNARSTYFYYLRGCT